MIKRKRQSASTQSPPPEPDIDQAFQLLRPCVRDRDPHRTAGKINQAIVEGDARLWKREKDTANKPVVHVRRQSFSAFYNVVAVEQPDGWHAEVQLRAGTFFGGDEPAKYTWIMSTKEINDLRENETLPSREQSSGRQRGRRVKFGTAWDQIIARLICLVHEKDPSALNNDLDLATRLVEWCEEQGVNKIPEIDTVRQKLPIWLAQYRKN